METLKFVDLFAGIGGFHVALSRLGHECVFASEIDEELRHHYQYNFPSMKGKVFGDIRAAKSSIPDHDILCAGFPCQPFSKSGGQLGTKDETRGTLFHEILDILEHKRPRFVLLENVGNFGRHDGGRTWKIVRERLMNLGYNVVGTEHRTPSTGKDWRDVGSPAANSGRDAGVATSRQAGGHGLISPHHFGHPHHRERFFIVATLGTLPNPPFPALSRQSRTSLNDIVQSLNELSPADAKATLKRPTMAGKGSGGSSFFLRNASHSAWREASCANSSVRPTGSASGTAMPRLSKVALIAWASRSVSRVSLSNSTDRSK